MPTVPLTADLDRAARLGSPEVVYGEGKSAEELCAALQALCDAGQFALATRVSAEKAERVCAQFPRAERDAEAELIWVGEPPAPVGDVVVVSAGTSDRRVAREAAGVARLLGNHVHRIDDVGVAGLHRVLGHRARLESARVVIVVAGMDGALPSVVGGLVRCPVIAVPTSVGYGSAFEGLAALLSMLNSCAPGVAVVNIDNGFGAAYAASRINRQSSAP